MLVSALPLGSFALTTDHITLNMDALRASSYPDGWYWCGGDVNKSVAQSGCGKKTTCYCNNFNGSYQCHGFALNMALRVVGNYPAVRLLDYKHGAKSNGWQCYTSVGIGKAALCSMGLRPGDIVRASTTSDYSNGHTAIVWKIEDGKVYFAECWGSVYSKIQWGAFNAAYTSMEGICSGYTYVALWRNTSVQVGTGQCPHNYKEGYENKHPHRKYTACVYCQKTEYTGEYEYVSSCVCCKGVHDYVLANEELHPHRETKTCRICGYFTYSGKTVIKSDCPVCLGIPYDIKAGFTKEFYNLGEALCLEFKAENAVRYDVTVKKDGVTVKEVKNAEETSILVDNHGVGVYIANVTAYAKDDKSVSVTSSAGIVKALISSVQTLQNRYLLTYSVDVDKNEAERLCFERGLTLESVGEGSFTASFEADGSFLDSEYISGSLYTYIPCSLPYHEAADFCRMLNGVLAVADSAEAEQLMVSFCKDKPTDGILLGATDQADEGVWMTEEGTALEYFNWNISYDTNSDLYKNYMFMFPGGTMTVSNAVTGYDHGFVLKINDPFVYSENEDGSLTLQKVKAIVSERMEIPAYSDGKPITAIAADAFTNGIYGEIVIPKTVTSISPDAFSFATVEEFAVYRDSAAHQIITELFDDTPYRIIIPFEDISKNAWYYSGIEYCYVRYYISGVDESHFAPGANITREQFVMMLSKLAAVDLDAYKEAQTGMNDVPSGQWYSAPVAWAVSEGYVKGVSEGVFGRGQNITREQMARLFYLYAEKKGMDVASRAELSGFEDEAAVSPWAYENVSWAVSVGLISGMTPTTIGPRGYATRAQAARMFMVFDNIE